MNIDASNVYEHDPDLYSKIVRYPLDIIPLLDVACLEEAVKIKPDYEKAIEVCDLSASLPVSSTVSLLGYADAKSNVSKSSLSTGPMSSCNSVSLHWFCMPLTSRGPLPVADDIHGDVTVAHQCCRCC